jgi:hypothetical protein
LAPSGTLLQDNCGETLSPTQFGLVGALALLLATFFGMILPSASGRFERAVLRRFGRRGHETQRDRRCGDRADTTAIHE